MDKKEMREEIARDLKLMDEIRQRKQGRVGKRSQMGTHRRRVRVRI